MNEDWRRMTLRLPSHLKAWIETQTRKSRRSMNGEIVACIERWRDEQKAATGQASQA